MMRHEFLEVTINNDIISEPEYLEELGRNTIQWRQLTKPGQSKSILALLFWRLGQDFFLYIHTNAH